VTYKIDARHVGERVNKHFEGTVKRHLKADQQKLPLSGASWTSPDGTTLRIWRRGEGPVPADAPESLKRQIAAELHSRVPDLTRWGSPEAAAQCKGHRGSPCMECGYIAPAVAHDFDDSAQL
jgi:hypothetical protein